MIDPFYEGVTEFMEVIRLEDLVAPNIPCLLPKDISTLKLQSQNLGSNYLSTALCSIAVQEELVYTCLGSDALSEDGKYTMWCNDMGERLEMVITDTVPAVKEGQKLQPFFLNSNGSDIWAYILEKAYAQKFGLYSSIVDGEPYEVIFSFFDGDYKIYEILPEKADSIWTFLKTHFKSDETKKEADAGNEYMDLNLYDTKKVITAIKPPGRGSMHDKVCFKVVDYRSIKAKERLRYVKLLIIDESYKDLMKISSRAWGEEEINALDTAQYLNGAFWLLYEDLLKHFSTLAINTFKLLNVKPEYNKSVLKLSLDGDHSCVLIYFETQHADDKYVISVHQKHKNFFKNIRDDYQYANLRMVLIRLDEKTDVDEAKMSQDAKEVIAKLQGKKIFSARFEASADCSNNKTADLFIKPRLKQGRYIIALEVFWKTDYFKNINLSISSSLNSKVEPKLISSGANFDIVFYKTFVSYHLDLLEAEKSQDKNAASKILKTRDLEILPKLKADLQTKLKQAGPSLHPSDSSGTAEPKVSMNYLELMEGFFIVYCSYVQPEPNIRIELTIDQIFLDPSFIISPELTHLLDGEVLEFDKIALDYKHPILFFLIRRNLNVSEHKFGKLENFIGSFKISIPGPEQPELGMAVSIQTPLTPGAEKLSPYLTTLANLYFEHLYFEPMIEITVPNLRKPDKEILQSLARQAIKLPNVSQQRIQLLTYQFGLDAQDSDIIQDSDLSASFVDMNQETMTNLVRRYGKVTERVWGGETTQVKDYVLHSENFLAILVESKEPTRIYTECREFKVKNLVLEEHQFEDMHNMHNPQGAEKGPFTVEFTLGPKQTKLMVLNLSEGRVSYKYNYTVKYKLSDKL